MQQLVIEQPTLQIANGRAKVAANIRLPTGSQVLWFECDERHAGLIDAHSSDAFAVALLVVAMREGWEVVVEGSLSARLFYNLNQHYMELMRHCAPGLRAVPVRAAVVEPRKATGAGVIVGFSAGVDSFSVVVEHQAGKVPPPYELTHLLVNNVGSHGQTEHDHAVFEQRASRLANVASALKLELVAVDSNLDQLLAMNFQLTHVARNAAVGLLLQQGIGKYLYAAAYHYRDCRVIPTPAYGDADALLVPMLSTEAIECVNPGAQFTRFEKTERIADYAIVQQSLDVCAAPLMVRDKINCSRCWKCLRTQLTLDLIGKLDRFDVVFDRATYEKYRWLYMCHVAKSPKPMAADIRAGMQRLGLDFPLSVRVAATLLPVALIENATNLWPVRNEKRSVYTTALILYRYFSAFAPDRVQRRLLQYLRSLARARATPT